MILYGLAEKTVSKLSSKNMRILNQFSILTISIRKFVANHEHIEYEFILSDELLVKQWTFYFRFSEIQKLDKLLRKELP